MNKKFLSAIFAVGVLFGMSYGQTSPHKVSKQKYNIYSKYVAEPLEQNSFNIYSGIVNFNMTIWNSSTNMPAKYNCKMSFTRWPLNNCVLPNMDLSIGDSVRYVIQSDTFLKYDLKTSVCETGSFKEALQLLYFNPFIGFYVQWFECIGDVTDIRIHKTNELLYADFTFGEGRISESFVQKAGEYSLIYNNTKEHLLKQFAYTPMDNLQNDCGFAKIQYELVSYQSGEEVPSWNMLSQKNKKGIALFFRIEQRMALLPARSKNDIVKSMNASIDVGTRGKNKEIYHFPYIQ